jgi:hypothetical protein
VGYAMALPTSVERLTAFGYPFAKINLRSTIVVTND